MLFEGVWGAATPLDRVKDAAAGALRRALGSAPDHHAPYAREVLAQLPLGRMTSPAPLIEAVRAAGWTGVRIQRLRDVEWAGAGSASRGRWDGWSPCPRYALVADAPR